MRRITRRCRGLQRAPGLSIHELLAALYREAVQLQRGVPDLKELNFTESRKAPSMSIA